MKILILADPESVHTQRWANALAKSGIEIFVFGLYEFKKEWFHPSVNVYVPQSFTEIKSKPDGSFSKILYLKNIYALKKYIKKINPDIMHAHYASSYGLLGALSIFHPFIISVYGSDVYIFPRKNIFTKYLLKFNLLMADKILSTSKIMAQETKRYTSKAIEITPFGIDITTFSPTRTKEMLFDQKDIVIGTVKTLEDSYGIDYLIKAVKLVKEKYENLPIKLLIVGKGSKEKKYIQLVEELNLSAITKFTGFIDYDNISKYHNILDISVFVSSGNESFGVSVLEASACGKPVIVSDSGGLPEVVEEDVTGIVVKRKNVEETAAAIERLLLQEDLRSKFGVKGRERVLEKYSLDNCVSQMIRIYKELISK